MVQPNDGDGKMETGYRKAALRLERPVVSSTTNTTPSVSRTSSVNNCPSPDPTLGCVNVTLNRCSSTDQKEDRKKPALSHQSARKTDCCLIVYKLRIYVSFGCLLFNSRRRCVFI